MATLPLVILPRRGLSVAAPRSLLVGLRAIPFETWLLGASLAVAALAHAVNMGAYPAFSMADDEGIYVGQALAVLNGQGLAPYTYTYDHAPGGWLQLALWYLGTGGPGTFGTPIDGGRALMLLVHLGSAFLLFRVARRLGARPIAAAVAVLLFSLSPLAVFFQRMVLLDNLMVFWLLAALALLLRSTGRAATIAHQVHGAIGFTDEHVLHRFTLRLWSWRDEFGTEEEWASVLGGLLKEKLWETLT
jgi:hypothetical protein